MFGLLAAAAAFLVYANTIGNGFVWDDAQVIVNKHALRGDVLTLYVIADTVFDTDVSHYYRPLTYTTYLLEERFHGLNPLFMHLVNVLLHAANVFLVYFVARSLMMSSYTAFVAGLIFAVHPINAESVNFLSGGRNTLLACFFVLIAFLLHEQSIRKNAWSSAVAGAVAFLAGLLSKELAICVLPLILVQEHYHNIRTSPDNRRKAIGRLLPYLAGLAIYMVMRTNALSQTGMPIDITRIGSRLWDNIYIIPRYFMTMVWPLSLDMRYHLPEDYHPLALQLVAAWGCIIGLLWWVLRKDDRRVTLFGIAWAAAFWMPVSGLIAIPSAPLAERYLYAPAIGLWLVIADRTSWVFASSPATMRKFFAAAAGLLLVLASLTIARNFDWKNDITLFSKHVKQNPEIPGAHKTLGYAYLEAGNLDAAEREFTRTLELDPTARAMYNPLGTIRLEKGDLEEALFYLTEALAALPVDQDARMKRARVYEQLGRLKEALLDYQISLSIPGEYAGSGSREYAEKKVRELAR